MVRSPSRTPLVEFRLRLESFTTSPSRPTAVGWPLSWAFVPYSTYGSEGPLLAGVPPPATVRLQGLATLLTAYAPRSLAGFVSHRQRSWDSLFGAFSSARGTQAFPPAWTHLPFLSRLLPPPKRRAGLASRGSWALTLTRVPGDRRGFMASTTGCSLELSPFRVSRREPWRRFRSTSSHALRPTV